MSDKITNFRLRQCSYEILQKRAKLRCVSISAYLRHLISLGLDADESTPNERHDARAFIDAERAKNQRTVEVSIHSPHGGSD